MARSKINTTSKDLVKDGGNVLWSMILGEQIEMEITLSFLLEANPQSFTYECEYVEADNTSGVPPTLAKANGTTGSLNVRVPYLLGDWSSSINYKIGDAVKYGDLYFLRIKQNLPTALDFAALSDTEIWKQININTVFIQFPDTFGGNFTSEPGITTNTYAFFELAVKEGVYVDTGNGVPPLRRKWKPIRGLVELLYSPTEEVV